jgi:hypothetical protein
VLVFALVVVSVLSAVVVVAGNKQGIKWVKHSLAESATSGSVMQWKGLEFIRHHSVYCLLCNCVRADPVESVFESVMKRGNEADFLSMTRQYRLR